MKTWHQDFICSQVEIVTSFTIEFPSVIEAFKNHSFDITYLLSVIFLETNKVFWKLWFSKFIDMVADLF